MAELDADFDRPLRMSAFPVARLAAAEASFADSTGVLLTVDDLELDIVGEDLEYDGDGPPVAGTVTDVQVSVDGETWFTITDTEAAVEDLDAAIAAKNPLAFFAALLDGDDTVLGSLGKDELFGFAGDDELDGKDGDDVLDGGAGDDILDGGAGADQMRGGAGDDSYLVDDARDRVVESPGAGYDLVDSAVSFVLPDHVEALSLLGSNDLAGTGNALANVLLGNSGANRLDGRGGADEMSGVAGDDTYLVDDRRDIVIEEEDGGTDTVIASVSYALPDQVENLVLVGRAAIDGTGNDLANEITGNDSANVLDGGDGADTLRGGRGDDVYVLDGPADIVIEERGGGLDTIRIDGDIALDGFANVENVELRGDGDHQAGGNGLANRLVGNAGDNLLAGLLGNDTLIGGAGDDTLSGGAGNDVLEGGGGEDLLRGGSGRDRLIGGTGGDDFVVGDATRSVATITDFSRTDGDRLLIGELLAGLADGTDLAPYLSLRVRGSVVEVSVDIDGPGRTRPVVIASVQGDLGTDLASLLADGVIDRA
ncbi:MAG: calcium-binding protein [Geminicoccaceae bacterium]|nr:calcium-binding protein [Geminicoccaceae bacterium]